MGVRVPGQEVEFKGDYWDYQEFDTSTTYGYFCEYLALNNRKLPVLADKIGLSLYTLQEYSSKYYWKWRADRYDEDFAVSTIARIRRKYYQRIDNELDKAAGVRTILSYPAKLINSILSDEALRDKAFEGMSIGELYELLNKNTKTAIELSKLERTMAQIPNEYNESKVEINTQKSGEAFSKDKELTDGVFDLLRKHGANENLEPGDDGDVDDRE